MSSTTKPDFLTIAVDRNMLSRGQSHQLSQEALKLGVDPSRLAVEKGLLDAAQVDIVSALSRPTSIAPGYEVMDVLGYGGLGVVYRARQVALDRVVALKTIMLSRMDRAGALARFELEAKAVGKLRHPNIVTAYDYGTHEGRMFFAMELVDGEDLDDRIKRMGRLSETMAWSIARQTAAGLSHAVEANVIHRDIKPANLMLTTPPQGYSLPANVPMVKITDFGLAFLTAENENNTRLTMAGTTMGTPQYMAPEQLSEPQVDHRADIYALGATMYHLFAGVPPFEGDSTGQVLANKIKGKIRELSSLVDGISHASLKLVEAMMAAEPDSRPQTYEELINRIDGLANVTHEVIRVAPKKRVAEAETLSDVPRTPTDAMPTKQVSKPEPTATATAKRGGWGRIFVFLLFVGVCAGVFFVARDEESWKDFAKGLLPYEFFGKRTSNEFRGPVLIEAMPRASLFDGQSLDGWSKPRGEWTVETDSDGDPVLLGRTGVISRPLPPLSETDKEPSNYNLRMRADLRDADAIEVHFSVVVVEPGRDERYVLRVGADGVVLGRQDWQSRAFLPVTETLPMPSRKGGIADSNYHELRIGKHGTHWLAYFDDHLLGTLPVTKTEPIRSVGLVVQNGSAHFKDIRLRKLVSPREPYGKPSGFTGQPPVKK